MREIEIIPAGCRLGLPIIEIIPIGSQVTVGPHEGTVLHANIGTNGVRYEVGYWKSDEWKEVWIDDFLVKFSEPKQRIGYARPDAGQCLHHG
jgi:hypothetical protein